MTQGRALRINLLSVLCLPIFCVGVLMAVCQASQIGSAPKAVVGEVAVDRLPDGKDSSVGKSDATIFITSNGWHSSIVVPRMRLPRGAIPEAADFPDAAYLSLGWGDAEYFPARRPTFDMGLRAALGPTPAVVHLAGLRALPSVVFLSEEVVALRIPADGFRRLVDYLDGSFARGGAKRAR